MDVRHLNCGTLAPLGGRLLDGRPGVFRAAPGVCHCLLIDTDAGLVLVETGLGTRGVANPREWFHTWFRLATRPVLDPAETAVRQITEFGYRATDVRHIVLTHLDIDHAGGLADFPHAKVHVSTTEHTSIPDRRYRAPQFAHRPDWETYDLATGDDWFGLPGARPLRGVSDDIQLIPLPGHTLGHTGVAVRLESDRWLLHAGDAYFFHGQLDLPDPRMPVGYRAFERIVQADKDARRATLRALRELKVGHDDKVTIVNSHDPVELTKRSGPQEVQAYQNR